MWGTLPICHQMPVLRYNHLREGTACSLGMKKAGAVSVWPFVPVHMALRGLEHATAGLHPGHQWPACGHNGLKLWVGRGQQNEGPGIP